MTELLLNFITIGSTSTQFNIGQLINSMYHAAMIMTLSSTAGYKSIYYYNYYYHSFKVEQLCTFFMFQWKNIRVKNIIISKDKVRSYKLNTQQMMVFVQGVAVQKDWSMIIDTCPLLPFEILRWPNNWVDFYVCYTDIIIFIESHTFTLQPCSQPISYT